MVNDHEQKSAELEQSANNPEVLDERVSAGLSADDMDGKKAGTKKERKMRKWLPFALVGALELAFGAVLASHVICFHSWAPANCEYPEHCYRCGAYRGEVDPDAHLWNEATCSKPRTCAQCGLTEGSKNPDNHLWSDTADKGYLICERCGKVTGDMDAAVSSGAVGAGEETDGGASISSNSEAVTSETAETVDEGAAEAGDNETYVSNGEFTFTPNEYYKSLKDKLSADAIEKSDDDMISYAFVDNIKNPEMYAMLSFTSMDGQTNLGNDCKYKKCNPSPILVINTNKCNSADVAVSFVMACDPSLKKADAAVFVKKLADNFSNNSSSSLLNGIEYRMAGDGDKILFRALVQ